MACMGPHSNDREWWFSVIIMMMFAVPVGRFVNRNPTIQMLGLFILILIGFMLIIEGGHLAHLKILDSENRAVPKGYLLFCHCFFFDGRVPQYAFHGKKEAPVKLHTWLKKPKIPVSLK